MAVGNLGRRDELKMQSSLEKLSSGLRINRGADDPSGLAISTGMKSVISGSNVATGNTQDAISMMQTQTGGLQQIHDMLLRMRELAVRAANDATLTSADMAKLDSESQSLMSQIDQTAKGTTFNTIQVLIGQPTTTTTDLEFKIEWHTLHTDLDIHVIQPDGAHAWYGDQNPNGHGNIDIDATDGTFNWGTPQDPAVEHYNVASGAAETGNYDLWINYYGNSAGGGPGPWPDVVATVTVSMYRGTPYQNIQTFNETCTYQPFDLPWNMPAGPAPYGEVHVGSYYWSPLAVPINSDVQAGPFDAASNIYNAQYPDARTAALQVSAVSLASAASAQASIDSIDKGISNVSNYLQQIGSRQVDLAHITNDLNTSVIGLSEANSRIEDTDVAEEAVKLSIQKLTQNFQTSALAYASNLPSDVLKLLNVMEAAPGQQQA